MYNFIGGNGKSSAQKWLRPSNQEQFDDDYDEYDDYRQYRNYANKAASGTTSTGPVKIINNQQTSTQARPSSASWNTQKSQNNSSQSGSGGHTGAITRSKVFDMGIFPKRLALSYQVPTIIIEYLVPKTGKLYHHKIKIRELKADSNKEKVLKQIKRRHEIYLIKIPDRQLLGLIEILQENILVQQQDQEREPEKPVEKSSNKEQKSDKKANESIINPFSKKQNITDSQISVEEKELFGKLKNQFEGEEDSQDEQYSSQDQVQNQKKKEGNSGQKQTKNHCEEEDEEEGEENENNDQKKKNSDDIDDYDYDFDEYTENDNSNNISKPFSQDTSQISNGVYDIKVAQKQLQIDAQKEILDSKLNKEHIHSKVVKKQAKVDYDDEIDFSDQENEVQSDNQIKANKNELEESDGQRDFDVDSNAIYQHQFAKNNYSHKVHTQEESQYTDEQEEENFEEEEEQENFGDEEDEEEQGQYEDKNNQNESDQEQENQNDDQDDEFELDDIEKLHIDEKKSDKKELMNNTQKNNFLQSEDKTTKQLQSDKSDEKEKKKLIDESNNKEQVKFEQTLSSKKPEMQMKQNQPNLIYGKFVPKTNNYVDADEGIDLDDEDDDFQMDFVNQKNKDEEQEEEDYEDDEEDLYQQVKKKLGNLQQKETTNQGSDYKNNLQQKKYEIAYYQQKQQQQQQQQNKQQSKPEQDEDEEDYNSNDNHDNFGDENGEDGEEEDDYGIDGEEDYGDEGEYDENDYEIDDIDIEDQYQVQQANQKYSISGQTYQKNNNQKSNMQDQKNLFDQLENELEENLDNLIDYDEYDLNKLSKSELDKVKQKMDQKFEQNRKKPGDKDFVYDVRESFDANESNQWDVSQSQDKHQMEQVVDYDIV
ncbi:hypothetical protein TTHERM_01016150 (macronuclear) [Tetrahymena thermophila SB210]|uniref:Uncharacterized protein n=1 Tax=Tetrahymena thermophila (strain SB210) TaxID=312017 RepID=Q22CS6_TETTS|nr:hypothetical protein TTHERM_01016150 [Tetrahymena thermophila SB210]EAR83112.2 hypothetical protein TTHERM_01016150 [Tetrahymena thermophila SB210]|eukprot:XP_001030775.2 hypothetical protein TTHERM_01016150 [Tetrahymena thermophila SB210]